MDDKMYHLNRLYAIIDTLVCLAAIICFGFGAYHFGKWWLNIFSIIPLLLFSQHSLVIEADLQAAKIQAIAPRDDIDCMKEQEGDHHES